MPNNWKKYKLKDLTTKIGSGSTPRGGDSAYINEGISLIRSQNILDFTFSYNGLAHINEQQAKELNGVTIYKDDVLINITGDSVARVSQVPDDVLPARINQHVAILRTNQELLNAAFLKYYLLQPRTKSELLNISSSGATRKAITKVMLEDFPITLPPLPEQQTIAEILSSLDDKIELNLQTNKTLEEMANALYKHWFVDFGPFKEGKFVESELGLIPEGWEVANLKSLIVDFNNKRGPISSMEREKIKGNYPYYGATGILDNVNKFGFDGRYILVAEDGTVKNNTNNPYLQYIEGKFWVSNHAHIIRGNADYPDSFIYYTLSNTIVLPYITGAVQPKLSKGSLESIVILKPTSDAAFKFSKIVDEYVDLIFQKNYEIENLKQTRDYLLPKLISGEIQVKEAAKNIKEVL